MSNTLQFDLELLVRVRIKAWRVFPGFIVGGGGLATGDPFAIEGHAENIRNIFQTTGLTQGRVLASQREPRIRGRSGARDTARRRRLQLPRTGISRAEQLALFRATDDEGNFLHFDPGAINFYFVEAIDDYSTHAFTWLGSESFRSEFVVFQDNVHLLSLWELAHVAAHEVGHVLGLPHVCADDPAGTTFGRTCSEGSDPRFLMYPSTNVVIGEDNVITDAATESLSNAALLHILNRLAQY